MYTELVFKASIKAVVPAEVEVVLQYLFNNQPLSDALPNHPFFECARWAMIGRSSSYYHVPWSTSRYKEGYIFSRSDLKNYEGEIEMFIDWIKPYLEQFEGDCIGYTWYEEDPTPTLIVL